MIKTVIVDDHEIVREGLKRIIEQDCDITVVGCAGDGEEALNLCDIHHPDLVLMDAVMPLYDGFEGLKMIKEKYKSIKVLIITMLSDKDSILRAVDNGADGYVLKDIKGKELIHAIKCTVNGLSIMPQDVLRVLRGQFVTKNKTINISEEKSNIPLTKQEKEIIKLIVHGKSNKDIALKIYLSEGRVRNIMTKIYNKFGVKDRTQLAVYAVKNNIV